MAEYAVPWWIFPTAGPENLTGSAYNMDSATDRWYMGLMAVDNRTIDSITIATASVAGTVPQYTLRLETQNAATRPSTPSGTLVATGAEGTFTPSTANTAYTVALTTPWAPTPGTPFIVVIQSASATVSNYASFRAQRWRTMTMPYNFVNISGTDSQTNMPVIRLNFSDGSFSYYTGVIAEFPVVDYNSASNPDEYALRFKCQYGLRVFGFGGWGRWLDTSSDVRLSLRADDDTLLDQFTMEGDTHIVSNVVNYEWHAVNNVNRLLAADTWYRICVEPTTTSSYRQYFADYATEDDKNIVLGKTRPSHSQLFYAESADRVNGGAWTARPNRLLRLYPLIETIDIPTGGGSYTMPSGFQPLETGVFG